MAPRSSQRALWFYHLAWWSWYDRRSPLDQRSCRIGLAPSGTEGRPRASKRRAADDTCRRTGRHPTTRSSAPKSKRASSRPSGRRCAPRGLSHQIRRPSPRRRRIARWHGPCGSGHRHGDRPIDLMSNRVRKLTHRSPKVRQNDVLVDAARQASSSLRTCASFPSMRWMASAPSTRRSGGASEQTASTITLAPRTGSPICCPARD